MISRYLYIYTNNFVPKRINHVFFSKNEDQTEFDDLISALRTGDVFGENMDKFKRNRKLRTSPPRVERMESFLRERSKERILN